ncbi:MAG: tyrosine protein phosphatase, partial [Planctomycetia bacterium]
MKAELYPIDETPIGRLAVMPRPRAGDWLSDEIVSLRSSGVDVLVSLLDDEETEELGLLDEADACRAAGVLFLRHPIPDRGVPTSKQSLQILVGEVVDHLRAGR